MALLNTVGFQCLLLAVKEGSCFQASSSFSGLVPQKQSNFKLSSSRKEFFGINSTKFMKFQSMNMSYGFWINSKKCSRNTGLRASEIVEEVEFDGTKKEGEKNTSNEDEEDGPTLMDEEERQEWRRKIREVIDMDPHVKDEEDPIERRKMMQKLMDEYPLVVDEEDPDWPEDADGRGFNLDQFFNKITIKNVRKDDDENYDSDKELVWQDDDYIRPVKDITTTEWEETVFKDISPLIVLVHNRYRRPRENEKVRDELEKAVQIFWVSRLPSPRCVAIDAVVELDLVSALKVSVFPEIIFTKAGKILYRERAVRTADELSKIMAFFYYGASKPPCLNTEGDSQEVIPSVPNNSE
ncbi:hypothetical protein HHK36_013393 [Tetracentron sinense]|uniref:Thioredoxin-like fold domain-containing protein MRL7L, chloroplastic n=1 Tax=Tetracentron sinense TaxID=13715 RepID=A0A835DJ26_TETSI|nr:hypothetical protein HHK36_013393 [Tetracentron sinense]